MTEAPRKGMSLIRMTIILMILYNAFYLCGLFLPNFIPGVVQPIYQAIREHNIIFVVLEALGGISLFVDLVGGWDNRKGYARAGQVWLVVILNLLVILKFALMMLADMLPSFA